MLIRDRGATHRIQDSWPALAEKTIIGRIVKRNLKRFLRRRVYFTAIHVSFYNDK